MFKSRSKRLPNTGRISRHRFWLQSTSLKQALRRRSIIDFWPPPMRFGSIFSNDSVAGGFLETATETGFAGTVNSGTAFSGELVPD